MGDNSITVVIPTIPKRPAYLNRAMSSVMAQYHPADAVIVTVDYRKEGAGVNRQRGLDLVQTEWVAFLDDDDEMYPEHLLKLLDHALYTGAEYVWSWFDVVGGTDPFPDHFGKQWTAEACHQTTITTLVKTELAQKIGFLGSAGDTPDGNRSGEDWAFSWGVWESGVKTSHLPVRTWAWHHHGKNTSGMPDRW